MAARISGISDLSIRDDGDLPSLLTSSWVQVLECHPAFPPFLPISAGLALVGAGRAPSDDRPYSAKDPEWTPRLH
jgi:hypothetical protein